jgi:hypothetical protein
MMRNKVAGMDLNDLINMDQMRMSHSFHSSCTFEKKGDKNVHTTTMDTKQGMPAKVSTSWKLLHPILIFKGSTGGRIETRKIQMYPDECVYACQPKGWMDKTMMNFWIDQVLMLWYNMKNQAIFPLLTRDAYWAHMMGSIVNCIQSLGIEVQHIPSGCTYLCQPVDVGVNHPIKKAMSEQLENWMLEGKGIETGIAKTPTRKFVAKWINST